MIVANLSFGHSENTWNQRGGGATAELYCHRAMDGDDKEGFTKRKTNYR